MKKLLGAAVLLVALTALAVTAAAADTGGTDRPFTGTIAGSATFPARWELPDHGTADVIRRLGHGEPSRPRQHVVQSLHAPQGPRSRGR